MKKYIKKIGAVIMALSLLLTVTGISSFAETKVPSASDDPVEVTVENVESGATVTGYKVVQADYTTGGLTGYSTVAGVTIADVSAPTEAEIAAIVSEINSGVVFEKVLFTEADGKYTAEVGAGSYVVLVSDTATTLYNPMIISAGYDENSVLQGGTVDANGKFTVGDTTYYAKKSKPEIDKSIVDSGSGNVNGDDLAIADEQKFKIITTIPDYSEAYTHATFKITDKLDGLTYEANTITVKDGENNLISEADASVSASGSSIEVAFSSEYILAHGNETITVEYTATLNEDAGINFDANTNKVKLTYTNDPSETSDANPKTGNTDDITYHYTFGIDANLGGTTTESTKKTHEIIKVDENGNTVVDTVNEGIDTITTTGALAEAEFTLTNKDTKKQYSAVSDNEGYLSFTGLDAGEYELVETKAPNGYSLDTTTHSVLIEAFYNQDGTLQFYSIKIDGQATSTYTATYDNGEMTEICADDQTTVIKNTKIGALPSTGGIGTYLFTFIGVFIMAGAVILYAHKRRNRAEK